MKNLTDIKKYLRKAASLLAIFTMLLSQVTASGTAFAFNVGPSGGFASLKVTKIVVGGNKTAVDFPLSVTNTATGEVTNVDSEVLNPFIAGEYNVSEVNDDPEYIATFEGVCDANGHVVLADGDVEECIIKNTFTPIHAYLTISKVVEGGSGSKTKEEFALSAIDAAGASTAFTTDVEQQLAPGSYTASEVADADYTATFSGDCDLSGQIDLVAGDHKVCTIKNTNKFSSNRGPSNGFGAIKVLKVVVGGDKAVTDFPLFVTNSVTSLVTPVTSDVQNAFHIGEYDVSETNNFPEYTATFEGACDANGHVVIADGDVKTCIIKNTFTEPAQGDDMPKLTVVKKVINNNPNNPDPKAVADFQLFVVDAGQVGQAVTSGDTVEFLPGVYKVTEVNDPSEYTATFEGDCDMNGNITLANGDNFTCTITNDDIRDNNGGGGNDNVKPKLTVIKKVINDNPNGPNKVVADFPLTIAEGDNVIPVVSGSTTELNPGFHLILENNGALDPDYTATYSGDCDSIGSINLANGDDVTCTITNDDNGDNGVNLPSLTVTKVVDNGNGGNKVVADFPLFLDGNPVNSGDTVIGLATGVHTVTETNDATKYKATYSADCPNGVVNLALGDNKNCIITNSSIPAFLTVTKIVVNDGGGTKNVEDFDLFVNNIIPVNSGVKWAAVPGEYTVSETADAQYKGVFSGDCDVNGKVSVDIGEVKNCILTNTFIAPRNPGNGDNNNQGGGGVVCILCGSNNNNNGDNPGQPGNNPSVGDNGGSIPEQPATPTGEVLGEAACGPYLFEFIKYGHKNNPDEVVKLQLFLNEYLKTNLKVNGVYNLATVNAVKKFQKLALGEVLKPWGLNLDTGFVYLTTRRWINMIKCPSLNLPVPAPLTPWSQAGKPTK